MSEDIVVRLRTNVLMAAQEAASTIEALRGEKDNLVKNCEVLSLAMQGADKDRRAAEAKLKVVEDWSHALKINRDLWKDKAVLAEAEAARLKGALVEQVKQYPDYSDICRKALAGETT